ncbi:hypothetical protein ACS0TY_007978 [Phlomoides rotata]
MTKKYDLKDGNGNLAIGAIANLIDILGAAVIYEDHLRSKNLSADISISYISPAKLNDELETISRCLGEQGAIVHGSSLPLFLRFFADLVNSFGSNADNVDKMSQEVLKILGIDFGSNFSAISGSNWIVDEDVLDC